MRQEEDPDVAHAGVACPARFDPRRARPQGFGYPETMGGTLAGCFRGDLRDQLTVRRGESGNRLKRCGLSPKLRTSPDEAPQRCPFGLPPASSCGQSS